MNVHHYFQDRHDDSHASHILKYVFGVAFFFIGLYLRQKAPVKMQHPIRNRFYSGHFFCIFRGVSLICQAMSNEHLDTDGFDTFLFTAALVFNAFSISWLFLLAGPICEFQTFACLNKRRRWIIWDINAIAMTILIILIDIDYQAIIAGSVFDMAVALYLAFFTFLEGVISGHKIFIALYTCYTVLNWTSYILLMSSKGHGCSAFHCMTVFDLLNFGAVSFLCAAIVYERKVMIADSMYGGESISPEQAEVVDNSENQNFL